MRRLATNHERLEDRRSMAGRTFRPIEKVGYLGRIFSIRKRSTGSWMSLQAKMYYLRDEVNISLKKPLLEGLVSISAGSNQERSNLSRRMFSF